MQRQRPVLGRRGRLRRNRSRVCRMSDQRRLHELLRPVCSSGTCTPCTGDQDCEHLTQTPACKLNSTGSSGKCVQCTTVNANACGTHSCNPATNQCTGTTVGTVDYCHACVADTECIGGNQANPTAGCVPMNYGTTFRGNYCLAIGTTVASCTGPFGVLKTPVVSVSGAAAQSYCGINEQATTCEAIQDLITLKHCGTSSDCGCTSTDNCAGGLCPVSGAMVGLCTIPCTSTANCLAGPPGNTCPSASPYCQ